MRKILFHRRNKPDLPLLETTEDGRQTAQMTDYQSTSINPMSLSHTDQNPSFIERNDQGLDYPLSSSHLLDGAGLLLHPHSSPNSQQLDFGYTSLGQPKRVFIGGFNTSISDLFVYQSDRTVDVCSLFCCGVLQFEFNRYFLTGGRFKPKNFSQRFLWYIFIPAVAFSLASYFAVHIDDASLSALSSSLLILFSFSWIIYFSFKSSMRRGQVRSALIRWLKEHGNDRALDDIDITAENGGSMEDEDLPRCIGCVHRSCSFYRVDFDDELEHDIDHENLDFCSLLNMCFSKACCGYLCGCWLQCCGVCGLAQEARQVNRIIPPEKRLVDYITFERYCDYFEHIKKLRLTHDVSIFNHFRAISKLSRMLLKTLGLTTLVLFLFSMFAHVADFQLANLLVYVATFSQAFGILFLVHWCYHKFDLSIDAIIKYFACGFILCTSSVFCFELAESITLQLILLATMLLCEQGKTFQSNYYRNVDLTTGRWIDMSTWDDYKLEFSMKYPAIVILYLFIGAFFIAALTEEVCKYCSFIICEHPDFIFDSEKESLYEKSLTLDSSRFKDYNSPHPSVESSISNAGNQSFLKNSYNRTLRKKESIGAAITVAMVTTAVGFACCENLVYIFLYNGSSATNEIAVLLARSLFPVHPLCAAIQSIGLCKKLVEKEKLSMGTIIFPAILLHGSYDFCIMVTTFLSILSGRGDATKGNPLYLLLSFVLSFSIVIVGVFWYWTASNQQRSRLRTLDSMTKSKDNLNSVV